MRRAPFDNLLCFGLLSAIVAICIGAPLPCPAADDLVTLEQRAFRTAVARVAPSVVRIETTGGAERVDKLQFGTGAVTGLVVGADGYILSSAFNFLNNPASILVRLPQRSPKAARVVATDRNRMLTLLKVDVEQPLVVPEWAAAGDVRVGQWAIAVGRVFEVERTNITVGLISATNRVWGKAIQTDAAVSPNNYGGPLVDIQGRVLGILLPLSPMGDKESAGVEWYDSGIGFAVPAWDLEQVVPRLIEGEDLLPGLAGVGFAKGSENTGEATIASIHPRSPADKAGLKSGDRIVRMADRKTTRVADVREELSRRYAGDSLRMVVLREQKRIETSVTLVAELVPYTHPFLGILPMRDSGSGAKPPTGIVVRYVYPDSRASSAGVKPQDRITHLNDRAVAGAAELREAVEAHEPSVEVVIRLVRDGQERSITLTLGRLPEVIPAESVPPANGKLAVEDKPTPDGDVIKLKVPEFSNDAWAYIPEATDPSVSYGLVVCLQSPGGYDWDELLQQWQPLCDANRLILLAPKPADSQRWRGEEMELIRKLTTKIIAEHNVDASRVAVHGYEVGGTLGYLLASRYRDLYRAVAVVESPMTGRPPRSEPGRRIAYYVASSEGARVTGRTKKAIEQLRQMQHPVVEHDLGPEHRYLNADELKALVRWLDTLDRI